MNREFYLTFYGIILIVFLFIMFVLAFSRYNKKVLHKSYLDTKLYIYISMISSIFFLGTILWALQINVITSLTYLVFALIYLSYCIAIMITLFVLLRPLKKINDKTYELALGKKNLNIDFEGSAEFESIAKDLNEIQKNYRKNDQKLGKKDAIYQKFISKNYLKYFAGKKIEDIEVGENVQVKLCTLFCDMRNSYFSSETLSLIDNFQLISDFVASVSENIKNNNGFVDRFVGDGVLGIFDDENDALTCANQIAKQLDYKNVVSIGKEPIKFGISLNSGMCVVGVVGNKKQKQFTVVSDVVNLCSRLESLNKIFGTRVLMTKNFMANLKQDYSARYVGTIEFDDLTSKIPLFESLDAYTDARKLKMAKTIQEFESGVRFYEKGDYDNAKKFFMLCVKNENTDSLSRFYLSKTIDDMSKLLPDPIH